MNEIIVNIHFDHISHSGSASAQRPDYMLEAFKAEGYEVTEITGAWDRRQARAKEAMHRISEGWRPQFVYAESSTTPHMLGTPNYLPKPSNELALAALCQEKSIPTGIFYRDIYWKFDRPKGLRSQLIHHYYKPFYKKEWRSYSELYAQIFLPTTRMMSHIQQDSKVSHSALPPATSKWVKRPARKAGRLRMVYVGGFTSPKTIYGLKTLLQAVQQVEVDFVLCCRVTEFERVRHEYPELAAPNIEVKHPGPDEVQEILFTCDIGSMVFDFSAYREFAFPYKVFEYLGAGLPIIATEATAAADFVIENKVGWKVADNKKSIVTLLRELSNDIESIGEKSRQIEAISGQNTWRSRAKEVAQKLLNS